MKKALSLVMTVGMLVGILSSCGQKGESASSESAAADRPVSAVSGGGSDSKMLQIGVVQGIEHEAMNQVYLGFVESLKEEGFVDGDNIQIDFQNAQGDQANNNTIAKKFVSDKKDLVLSIATQSSQSMVSATKEIPIVFTAVTDPVDAKLVASVEKPGGNVTGTSDMNYSDEIGLILALKPETKTIGLLYCSSESNSKVQIDAAAARAKELGVATKEFTVTSSNDIQQVVSSMVGQVDAVYIPTDNTLANGINNVTSITNPKGIPVVAAEEGMVKDGKAAGSYTISYFNLGKMAGKQAVRILNGEKPGDIPVEYLKEYDLVFNETAVNQLGLTIPEDLKAKAKMV